MDIFKKYFTVSVRTLLIAGIIGALVTMIGDFLLMAFNTADVEGMMGSFLSAAEQTTYTRIGLAAFFGFGGIPVAGAGYLALCGLTKPQYRESRAYRLFRASTIAFTVLGGGKSSDFLQPFYMGDFIFAIEFKRKSAKESDS